jgi:CHAD domain-containing protein
MKSRSLSARSSPPSLRSSHASALQLLADQHAVIRQTVGGACEGNPDALHDLRAAFRRARCLLRVFPERFPGAKSLSRLLGRLNQELGEQRDRDVWVAFLDRLSRKRRFRKIDGWAEFVQSQAEERLRQLPLVRRVFRSRRFAAVTGTLQSLLSPQAKRTELEFAPDLVLLAARALRRLLRRVRARDGWKLDERHHTIHAARLRYRRVRYLAEFFVPFLGAGFRTLVAELHNVEQCLGQAHDMDRARAFLAEIPLPPKPLITEIRQRRKKALDHAREAASNIRWVKWDKRLKRALKP